MKKAIEAQRQVGAQVAADIAADNKRKREEQAAPSGPVNETGDAKNIFGGPMHGASPFGKSKFEEWDPEVDGPEPSGCIAAGWGKAICQSPPKRQRSEEMNPSSQPAAKSDNMWMQAHIEAKEERDALMYKKMRAAASAAAAEVVEAHKKEAYIKKRVKEGVQQELARMIKQAEEGAEDGVWPTDRPVVVGEKRVREE